MQRFKKVTVGGHGRRGSTGGAGAYGPMPGEGIVAELLGRPIGSIRTRDGAPKGPQAKQRRPEGPPQSVRGGKTLKMNRG